MISFYPGPSQLDSQWHIYLKDAFQINMLSENHRSERFMDLYEETDALLKSYLNIPASYSIFFISSATECWQILSQNYEHLQHLHVYNGAFGEKGFQVNQNFQYKNTKAYQFELNEIPEHSIIDAQQFDVIHFTQNETSNGTQLPTAFISDIRKKHTKVIISVDATSSMGGVVLPIEDADIWYASVQKCWGLPSGMALLICSPHALTQASSKAQHYYNSLHQLHKNYQKFQTTHTPNVLNIFGLYRILKDRAPLALIEQRLKTQAQAWRTLLSKSKHLQLLSKQEATYSNTIIAIQAAPDLVEQIHGHALGNGYVLGKGYGTYKNTSFRIANFPAHQQAHINELQKLLALY